MAAAPPRARQWATLVTGAASGIGRATCLELAAEGTPVVAWDFDGAGVEALAAECSAHGAAVHAEQLDLTATDALAGALDRAVAAVGPVGALAHCAGVAAPTMLDAMATDEWDRTFAVNTTAFAVLVRLLLPHLRDAGGAVVAVSSVTALQGTAVTPAYCASKAALLGLVRSMAHGLARDGVRVNVVCPGVVDTPMVWRATEAGGISRQKALDVLVAQVPLGRVAQPVELARTIRFLLSADASYITGATLIVDGGMTGCAAPLMAG